MTEEIGSGIEGEAGTDVTGTPEGGPLGVLTLKPTFGGPRPDTSSKRPSFSGTYVDPEDPESSGAPPAFSSLYGPSFYKGLIEAATFLVDLPIMAVGSALSAGAEALGWDEMAADLGRPVTLGGLAIHAFEAPARIEEAITGEPAVITSGFRATPRAARNDEERFWRDVFYISGGGISFPASLGRIFGTFRGPVSRLLQDAGGRGVNSPAANAALKTAMSAKGPSARAALVYAAQQYASRFTVGLGERKWRTLGAEQLLATSAGIGYGAPELFTDDDGRIMMDLGVSPIFGDMGEVDIMPSIKILSSMGLPIALAHTPTGAALAGDKTKILPLLRWITGKGRVFAKSLVGGFTEQGQYDLAARIFNSMESEPGFLENVFLPAVESGQFLTPGTSTPIRILTDGTVIPEYGGLRPDTLQALKQLGLDDTRLAALDAALRSRGGNLQARLGEETRRSERLDETFDLLRERVRAGDEADAYNTIEIIRDNLDAEALDAIDDALAKAGEVYAALEPALGRAEASRLAVEMLDGARQESHTISRQLWDSQLIGTEFVDTSSFGDWAIDIIRETDRNLRVTPGMAVLYKLAGRQRLIDELGIGESGRPLTTDDLGGVKGDTAEEGLLKPEEITENGLYDIFGEPGTLYAQPVKIETLQDFRSEIGDLSRAAYNRGDVKLGRRYNRIIDYIDDELLAAKNFEGFEDLKPENVRNIEIARGYTQIAKERFGPNSEIGRILYLGPKKPIPEEFLQKLFRSGPGSGARVELFRDALNEPQQVVQGRNVTWQRDPAATLTLGDNPNVIEAELLRRFTESVANGKVTQNNVDRFLRQYGEAIDTIEGLRSKFNDLAGLQYGVDAMTAKLTVPNREKVFAALKDGATPQDIVNARRLLLEDLTDRRLANTASDYLNADVDKAALAFIRSDPDNAAKHVDELAALLAKDETGAAEAGFRAALWRALRDNSRRVNADGIVQPGINTKKFVDTIEELRPYLEKFYDRNSMEILDGLVIGGPLQRTGTGVAFAGTVGDVMGANFATVEAIGAAGRTAGQRVFGTIGINPLVATGMGKRISAYTFGKIGEEKILKIVENALRDPEKAAELIRRYRELPDWTPPPATRRLAEDVLEDPAAVARGAAGDAKDWLSRIAGFVSKYISSHSREAIERAVRFGLIPAQAESRKLDLETDYRLGPPFVYDDNRIRYQIENTPNDVLEIDINRALGHQPFGRRLPPPRAPAPASVLSQVNPLSAAINPQTAARGQQVFGPTDPIFAAHGGYINGGAARGVGRRTESGIMSIGHKPRQIVG
jgi:tetratricopeptide (TPR) repeat protein